MSERQKEIEAVIGLMEPTFEAIDPVMIPGVELDTEVVIVTTKSRMAMKVQGYICSHETGTICLRDCTVSAFTMENYASRVDIKIDDIMTIHEVVRKSTVTRDLEVIYVDENQHDYFIEYLKYVDEVALSGFGNYDQLSCMRWVAVSAGGNLFLFDIGEPPKQEVFRALRRIFRDKRLLKVVHDGRGLAQSVFHGQDIKLFNVFDTMAAETFVRFLIRPENFREQVDVNDSWMNKTLASTLEIYLPYIADPDDIKTFKRYEKYVAHASKGYLNTNPLHDKVVKMMEISVKYLMDLHAVFKSAYEENIKKAVDKQMEKISNLTRLGARLQKNKLEMTLPLGMLIPKWKPEFVSVEELLRRNEISLTTPRVVFSPDNVVPDADN